MFSQQDATVVLAAADTFRAAAAEQLQEWAHRAGSAFVGPVSEKQRPAGVIKRAIDEGVKTQADVILCDTSGRLHTNWNLMEELAGCKRAIEKRVEGGAQEVLLVLDGTTGMGVGVSGWWDVVLGACRQSWMQQQGHQHNVPQLHILHYSLTHTCYRHTSSHTHTHHHTHTSSHTHHHTHISPPTNHPHHPPPTTQGSTCSTRRVNFMKQYS